MGAMKGVAGAIFKGKDHSRDRAHSKGSDQGYMPTVQEGPESETGSQTSSRPTSSTQLGNGRQSKLSNQAQRTSLEEKCEPERLSLTSSHVYSSQPGNGRQSKMSNRAERASLEGKREPERFSLKSSHISGNQQEIASARQSKSSSQANYSPEARFTPDRYSQTSSRSPGYRPTKHSGHTAQPRLPAPEVAVEERPESDFFRQNAGQRPPGPHFNDLDDVLAPGEVYEHNPKMKSTQEQAKEYCDLIGAFDFGDDSSESDTTPTEWGNRRSRMPPHPPAPSKRPPPAAPPQRPLKPNSRPDNTDSPLRTRPERPRIPKEIQTSPRHPITEKPIKMRPEIPRVPAERQTDPRQAITEKPVRTRPEIPRVSEENFTQRDIHPSPEPMNAVQRRIRDLERANVRGPPPPSQTTPDRHATAWMIAQQKLRDIHLEGLRAEEVTLEESKRGLANSRPYNVQSTGTRRSDRDIEDETLSRRGPRTRSKTKTISPKGQTGLGLGFAAMKM